VVKIKGRCSKIAVDIYRHFDKKVALCLEKHGIKEAELREGGKRREVTKVRREIAYYLSREIGVTMEEIVRNIGVGTSAVAMTLKQKEAEK
jgi:hypothetical protein